MRSFAPGSFIALVRVLSATAGRAAFRRALPTYFGLLIVAVVIFTGKYAMKVSELTGLARSSLAFRAVWVASWLVVSLPVARALLTSPSSRFVRVYPVSWTKAAAALGLGLLLVEGPWIILWRAGEGLAGGFGAGAIVAGGHALVLGRPRRWYEIAALGAWLGGFVLGPGLPDLLALPALVLGLRRVWIEGAEPRRPKMRRWVLAAPPAVALAAGHLASVARGQRPLLARWGWLALGGVGIAMLAIHNNGIGEPDRVVAVSLALLAPATALGALTIGGAILRGEHHAAWLLDTTGTSPRARVAAAALAVACCGVLFGLIHGLLVSQVRGAASLFRVTASAAGEGAALGALAAIVSRWTDRGGGHDSRRVMLVACVVAGVVVALVSRLQELGLVVALAVVGVGLAVAPPLPRTARARLREDQD